MSLALHHALLYMPAVATRRIVILGGGFAGFALARALDRLKVSARHAGLQVFLVAPGPFAQLSPLLPGLVSGWVEPWHLLVPLHTALQFVRWVPARATHIDLASNVVRLDGPGVRNGCDPASLAYDDLVLAVGSTPTFDGVSGAAQLALPLQSTHDAARLRNRLADAFEAAAGEDSARRRRALLTVVVVGSDAKACSVALECAAHLRETLRVYPRVEPADPRVLLITGGRPPCSELGPEHAQAALRLLDQTGVEVVSSAQLAHIANAHVLLRAPDLGTELIDARTVVWTEADAPAPCVSAWADRLDPSGRVRVDEMQRMVGSNDVFALGACARVPGPSAETTVGDTPGRILSRARLLARNLVARATAKPLHAMSGPPPLDPILLDHDQGLLAIGKARLDGAHAACLARNILLGLVPGWPQRQAIRMSWLFTGWTPSGSAKTARIQPGAQAL